MDGKRQVYLDLTHIPRKELDVKLGGILEIYEKFVGDDPRDVPMKVFPGMHYSMGGLWVQFAKDEATGRLDESSLRNQATNVPGLYAGGEVDFSIHGANRLGANSLVSCLYGGKIGGPAMVRYAREKAGKLPAADGAFAAAKKRWEEEFARIAGMTGPENAHVIAEEMGDWMTDNVTVVRENGRLAATENKLQELRALEPDRPDRPERLRQPRDLLHQPAAEHARDRPRHDARRAAARRVARRALQGPGPLEGA